MANNEDLSKSRIESVFNSNRDIKIEEFRTLNLSYRMLNFPFFSYE